MKRLVILAVVLALCLMVGIPSVTAETKDLPNGVTVINDSVLATPGTSQATIAFIEDQYGPPPAPSLEGRLGGPNIPD